MLNGVMADWKHDKIFYDAVCSASKLALPVRSVISTFNDRQIPSQQRLAMTDSRQIAIPCFAGTGATDARDDELNRHCEPRF